MSGKESFEKRQRRVRARVRKNKSAEVLRLSVFRSSKNIYAQVIDDVKGVTVASSSTIDKDLRSHLKKTTDKHAAEKVGEAVAKKALALGIKKVVFDRGGYLYHGRVQALATGARAAGLEF